MAVMAESCGASGPGPANPGFRCSRCKAGARFCETAAALRRAWPRRRRPRSQRRSELRPWPSPGKAAKIAGRIAFVDFWPGFEDNTDRWFSKNWFRANLPGVEVVEPHERPDVVMSSLFGRSRLRYLQNGSSSKLVFFTGENVRPPVGRIPLCISFDHMEEVPPTVHMRMPLWIFNKEVHDVLRIDEARRGGNLNSTVHKRAGFCSWVASNATMYNAEFRTRFVQILSSRYHEVACGGEVLNNVGGPIQDKMEFLRGYRFNICFENASHPGYCTEKLLHAFASESIPIYWGDPSCSSKGTGISDFNTEAFISAHDFENTAQLIKYIARVDQDPVLFESYLRQPIFSESWYRRLKDWPAFCSGFKDLLFAECHLGTPRLDPAPPTGQVPYTASGCAKQDGDRCRSVGMPPSDACNHKRNHVNTVLVNFLLLILILPIILCRGDQEMRIDLPL